MIEEIYSQVPYVLRIVFYYLSMSELVGLRLLNSKCLEAVDNTSWTDHKNRIRLNTLFLCDSFRFIKAFCKNFRFTNYEMHLVEYWPSPSDSEDNYDYNLGYDEWQPAIEIRYCNQFQSFHLACRRNQLEIAKWLHKRFVVERIEIIRYGCDLLVDVCKNGYCNLAKWLIEEFELTREEMYSTKKIYENAGEDSIIDHDSDVQEEFREMRKQDYPVRNILNSALKENHFEIIDLLKEKFDVSDDLITEIKLQIEEKKKDAELWFQNSQSPLPEQEEAYLASGNEWF